MKRKDGRKLSRKTLEEIRTRAVERVQSGESPEEVIAALGFSRACIYNWLAAYRAQGWHGLRAGRATGRPKKLKAHQIKWIYNTVTMKNPLQLQFKFALWTREIIRTLIYRRYGIKLSLTSVGRLLNQLGLSCQRPLFRAYQQQPKLVKRWVQREYPKIRLLAKQMRAQVYFSDESGIRSDFHSGTTWGIKGKTPIVKVTGQRFRLNMISAISPRGHLKFMVTRKSIGAKVFLEFLKRLVVGSRRPIFLIVDGHPAHKARLVKQFIASTNGKLRLFFLPPYSPELNPDEYVWNDVKNNGVGRSRVEDQRELRSAVTSRLRYLQKNPNRVKAFFSAPEVRYAA